MAKKYVLEGGIKGNFDFEEFKRKVNKKNTTHSREAVYMDIEKEVGIPFDTLKNWYKKKSSPQTLDKVKELADYFECAVEAFISFDEELIERKETVLMVENISEKNIIREIHKDLYEYAAYYFWEDSELKDLSEGDRMMSDFPLKLIRDKINYYILDLSDEAYSALQEMVSFLDGIILLYDLNYMGDLLDGDEPWESEMYKGLNWRHYVEFAENNGVDPYVQTGIDTIELCYKIRLCIENYYKFVKKEYLKLAKEKLKKFF